MNEPKSGANGTAGEARLVPLPRRAPSGEALIQAIAASPSATVDDLLERTDHLLAQLAIDIAGLQKDQDKERRRIEVEARERQVAAGSAIEQLQILAGRARAIAESKARTDELEAALGRTVDFDRTVTFPMLVSQIEQEIRLAKGITGAIRLQNIGDLLKQATLHVQHMTSQAEQARKTFIMQTEQELKNEGKEARASYEIGMSVVRRDLKALDMALPPSGLSWNDPRWERWEGWDPLSGASRWVRLGSYFRPEPERFRFPILAELPGPRGVAIDVGVGSREVAIAAARSVILRVMASVPAGDARFTFIDPTGLGDSVAPFLPLADFRDELVDGGVCTLEDEIEEKLTELNRHIERVIKQHLRGEFDTLEQLHDSVGEIVEPYRFVFAFDYPHRLTDRSRELFRTIIDNGPRCGVHTVLTTAPGAARSNGARWKGMLSGLDVITGDANGYFVQSEVSGRWQVELDTLTDLSLKDSSGDQTLLGRILATTGDQARQERRSQVTQIRLFELQADAQRLRSREDLADVDRPIDAADPATWWSGNSARGLGAPIGRAGAREAVSFWLDSGARSGAVIGGERGSGVSTLLHGLITGLSITYTPAELSLYLIDCAGTGTSGFGVYAEEGLPHARVVAVDAGREFGVSVLEDLAREMASRATLLARCGGERAGIQGYRETTGEELPRIVAVLDGVDKLVAVDDRLGDRAAHLFESLTRQGGPYGIHLVVASHGVAPLARLGRQTLASLRVRVALACSEEESKLVLGSEDGEASHFDQAGEGVLNLHEGDPGAALRFTTAPLEPHQLGLIVRELRSAAVARGIARSPQVYDGQRPARLEESSIHQLAFNPGMQSARKMPRVWLGEPAALGAAVEVSLRRAPGANMLLVGRDERLGQGLLTAALTSVALGHGAELDLRVLDLMPLESGFGEILRVIAEHAQLRSYRRRSRDEAFTGVLAEIDRRLADDDFRARPLLFVINGLGAGPLASLEAGTVSGAAANLMPEDLANPGVDPIVALEQIVRRGPEVGVHAIVWTDRLSSLAMHVTRATMREFALRVVMQMPTEDSALLIDSAQASTLQPNEALLYDEDAARVTKLRPYQLPSAEHVASLMSLASSGRSGTPTSEADTTLAHLRARVTRSSVTAGGPVEA